MLDRELLKKIFSNVAILLEIKGEVPFKTKAYHNIADILGNDEINFDEHLKNNTLKSIPGVGEAISKKIIEFAQTGKMEFYENLIQEYPEDLVLISKLAKIGVKKTSQIFKELGISNINSLEKACEENIIASLKGFGEKTQENILTSISHTKAAKGRFLQKRIINESNKLIIELSKLELFSKIEITGEQARFVEVLKDISIIALFEDFNRLELNKLDEFKPEIVQTDDAFLKLKLNAILDFPSYLYLTNSQNYIKLKHNLSSSDEYLKEFNKISPNINEASLIYQSEEALYDSLDLQYVPSELREFSFAVEKSKNKQIPKLIEQKDMKGVLHMHTIWSDGINTIREMALKSKELGFEYLGITDHSKTSVYTNGLNEERIIKQHQEIDQLNAEDLGIYIFKGIESDILLDGSLDYSDEVLESFDFVISSVHSAFNMPKKEMTKRICNALKNPYTMILGHPTGRLLLSRNGYELDIDEVINTAAEYGKIIELNANPYRLDLSWENIIKAKEKGVKISINPDSHKTSTLNDIFIGCSIARKGWLETNEVLNTLNLSEFKQFLIDFRNKRK